MRVLCHVLRGRGGLPDRKDRLIVPTREGACSKAMQCGVEDSAVRRWDGTGMMPKTGASSWMAETKIPAWRLLPGFFPMTA